MINEYLKHDFVKIMIIIELLDSLITQIALINLPYELEANKRFIYIMEQNSLIILILYELLMLFIYIILAMIIIFIFRKIESMDYEESRVSTFLVCICYTILLYSIVNWFITAFFGWSIAITLFLLTGITEASFYESTIDHLVITISVFIVAFINFILMMRIFADKTFWLPEEIKNA